MENPQLVQRSNFWNSFPKVLQVDGMSHKVKDGEEN